jgi:hypothetical protein
MRVGYGGADGGGKMATGNHHPRKTPGSGPSIITRAASERFDIEHLTIAIVAAGWAGDVRWHFAAALGAILEDGCMPTLRATAHFLTAFGLAALWNGHGLALV